MLGLNTHMPGLNTHMPGWHAHVPGLNIHMPGLNPHMPGLHTHMPRLNTHMLEVNTHMLGVKTHMLGLNTHMLGLKTHMLVHCRHDVQPDGQLYSSLMDVAGQAKRIDLAFDLQADMVAQGLQPSKVITIIQIIVRVIETTVKACSPQGKPPFRTLSPIPPHAVPSVHAHMLPCMVCQACIYICCVKCHACVAAHMACSLLFWVCVC